MTRVKIESQSELQVGDKFCLVNSKEPTYEILEETAPRQFTVKRLPSGRVDTNQPIPHPSGDFPCWKFID